MKRFKHHHFALTALGALALTACSQTPSSLTTTDQAVKGQAAAGFYVSNGKLVDPNGVPFLFQGINYPFSWYDSSKRPTSNDFAAMRAKGANNVRIVLSSGCRGWHKSSAAEVSSLINMAKANKMVAVLEVHDTTGYGEDGGACTLDNAANYWLEVKSALVGQEAYAIVNIGNEPWGNNNPGGWIGATKSAIQKLRSNGIKNTLMIDGPNWGQDWSNTMKNNARDVWNSDVDKNMIFSIHMYGSYKDSGSANGYIDSFVSQGLPLVVGEFANYQGGNNIDAYAIMSASRKVNGYIGWSWSGNGGGDIPLDMVNNFDANSPTPWGNIIFNDLRTSKVATHLDTVTPPPPPPPTGGITKTGERCGEWDKIQVGPYIYVNNTWGSYKTTGWKQCLQIGTNSAGQTVYGWNWNWPGWDKTVYSYPEIIYGYKPWDNMTSTDPRFPMKVNGMPNVQMTWDVTATRTGHYDFAPEIWLTNVPGDGPAKLANITTEIMIWLDYDAAAAPSDTRWGTATIDGVNYDIYTMNITASGASWKFIAYKGPAGRNSGTLNVDKFVKDAVAQGLANGEHYMSGIEFGDESSGGTGDVWVNKFEVKVNTTPTNNAPTVSLTAPTEGQNFAAGTTVNVAANASDSDGTVTKVDFYVDNVLKLSDTTAPYTYAATGLTTGAHSIKATATDNGGLSSSVTRNITVGTVNTPPTLSVSSPTEGQSFTAGSTVNVAATATDSDGVAKVEFYVDNVLKLSDTVAPYAYSAAGLTAGAHSVRVVATDTKGAATTVTRNFSLGTTPPPTGACKVVYTKQNDWGTGATVNLDITNTGTTAVSNWTFGWSFAGTEKVRDLWNGTFTQTGQSVSVKPASWNGTINPGQTIQVGYNVDYTGTLNAPATFTLNGQACSK